MIWSFILIQLSIKWSINSVTLENNLSNKLNKNKIQSTSLNLKKIPADFTKLTFLLENSKLINGLALENIKIKIIQKNKCCRTL